MAARGGGLICGLLTLYGRAVVLVGHCAQCRVYSLQYTAYSIQFTVYSFQYTVYSIQFIVYILEFTAYTVQLTLSYQQCKVVISIFLVYILEFIVQTLYRLKCTGYSLKSKADIIKLTAYSLHYAVYSEKLIVDSYTFYSKQYAAL